MPWTTKKIEQHLKLGEDSVVEFKQAGDLKRQRNGLADELVAMANAKGGTMFLSVSDDGEVLPLTDVKRKALDKTIGDICNDVIKPALNPDMQWHQVHGHPLLVVDIARSPYVHKSPKGYFLRRGSSKREMTPSELGRLMNQRARIATTALDTDEQPVPNTGINTLDKGLSSRFLTSRTSESRETLLRKLRLIGEDQNNTLRATVAGILLCTPNPETYLTNTYISAVRYSGTTRDSDQQLDAVTITGPLDRQIKDAVAFAVHNMQVAARKTPARVEFPQYSERAIFEAIVNAVIHRDYSIRGAHIRLFLYADRLELYSPGSLPNTLTVDSIREIQHARNDLLMSMLNRLPTTGVTGAGERQYFLEKRGEGVPIIFEQTKALTGREPVYKQLESALKLTLPSAPQNTSEVLAEVCVYAGKQPLKDAHVLALYPNKTWKSETTDSFGRVHFALHSNLPMTVFCAAPAHCGEVVYDWDPKTKLPIELQPSSNGGSVIFPEETGNIPSIRGCLNPILDAQERTYLYGTNIAIDDGKQQPVHFRLGDPVSLTDVDGNKCVVRFIEMLGKSALIDYTLE